MKTLFFLEKKHFFFIILSNFSNVQDFLFFCLKNLISKAEKTVLRNNTIWYAFYSKFATFSHFGKIQVFSKNSSIFFF